jgi:hypothetical protein
MVHDRLQRTSGDVTLGVEDWRQAFYGLHGAESGGGVSCSWRPGSTVSYRLDFLLLVVYELGVQAGGRAL